VVEKSCYKGDVKGENVSDEYGMFIRVRKEAPPGKYDLEKPGRGGRKGEGRAYASLVEG